MKKMKKISLIVVMMVSFIIATSFAQVAEKDILSIRVITNGLALVGANSNNTTAGPYFGGSIAYGLGHGLTLFAESGYGWTNINSGNNVELRQVPIVGGITYNFSKLFHSKVVQPYIGVAGGVYVLRRKQDGNSIFVSGFEQNATNFGLKTLIGVNFQISRRWGVDMQGNFSHIFSKNGDPGIESNEINSVGFGGSISYAF